MSLPKVLYVGPLKDFSGYASASRDYVMALDSVGVPLVTRALRYDGGDYVPSKRMRDLENESLQGVEIVLQHTTPNEQEPRAGKFNVGAFCWETDRIPQVWVDHLNRMELVLVPCQDNLDVAKRCGVHVPIEKVGYACDVEKYKVEAKPFVVQGAEDAFKFLSVFQFSKKVRYCTKKFQLLNFPGINGFGGSTSAI